MILKEGRKEIHRHNSLNAQQAFNGKMGTLLYQDARRLRWWMKIVTWLSFTPSTVSREELVNIECRYYFSPYYGIDLSDNPHSYDSCCA